MNFNALIVVADAARARLFRVVETDAPRAPIALREIESLVHPEARVKEGERHSGSFPGSGAQGHTPDAHRGAHETEERRRFSKTLARAVAGSVKEHSSKSVIVLATHSLHAVLAGELERELPKGVDVRSQVGELTELTPSEILEELQLRGLVQP